MTPPSRPASPGRCCGPCHLMVSRSESSEGWGALHRSKLSSRQPAADYHGSYTHKPDVTALGESDYGGDARVGR
jgi:hypothetical protein